METIPDVTGIMCDKQWQEGPSPRMMKKETPSVLELEKIIEIL